MSNAVFPSLPGMDIAVTRTTVYSTMVQASASGKELRASFASTPRYAYSLQINFLRKAGYYNTPSDEVTTLQAFFDQHLGNWDSFLFNDPLDGVQRRVRFDQPSLDFGKMADGLWSAPTVKLISVK